ncbi:hypothetical protein FGB62_7g668 [Gracilaria domingensis]|nr:hypothetical protein FGB62_7g668 [Gracilaria domingensis]
MSAFVPSSPFQLQGRSQRGTASALRRSRSASVRVPVKRLQCAPRCAAEPFADGQPPSGAVLCGALEVSFRNVWLRLMTSGVGPEYTHAISAFVLAAAASYKAGYSLTALKFELATHEKHATFMGRDVRLNDDEKKTRFIWLALVYLTLKRCQFPTERDSAIDIAADIEASDIRELMPGLAAFVNNVYDAAQRGLDLQRFKLELSLRRDDKSPSLDKAQVSIRSQWARIVFSTLQLMPESGQKR